MEGDGEVARVEVEVEVRVEVVKAVMEGAEGMEGVEVRGMKCQCWSH